MAARDDGELVAACVAARKLSARISGAGYTAQESGARIRRKSSARVYGALSVSRSCFVRVKRETQL